MAGAAFGAAVATRAGAARVVAAGRDAGRVTVVLVAVVLVARVDVCLVADGVVSGATVVPGSALVSVAGAGASGSGVTEAGVPAEVSGAGVCCAIRGVVEMARAAAIAVVVRRMLVCVWVIQAKPLPQRIGPAFPTSRPEGRTKSARGDCPVTFALTLATFGRKFRSCSPLICKV